LSDIFQNKIEKINEKAFDFLSQSTATYAQAENLLISALDMQNFTPPSKNVSIKTLTESFVSTGRLDSEYYQEKYKQYENKLCTNDVLNNICKLYNKNFTPGEKQEYKYIELSNIGSSGNITDASLDIGELLPTRARRIVKKGQVIVSSIEGSLSSCALVTDEYDGALCSTGFYVVSSKEINSETLLVLFKSKPIQELLKQRCSGTILTAISKEEFLNLPFPVINNETQSQIATLIQSSFTLRKESENLLETAKRAIEIAIEQDEDKAMEML